MPGTLTLTKIERCCYCDNAPIFMRRVDTQHFYLTCPDGNCRTTGDSGPTKAVAVDFWNRAIRKSKELLDESNRSASEVFKH